jgi:predicted phage-related endonuclease
MDGSDGAREYLAKAFPRNTTAMKDSSNEAEEIARQILTATADMACLELRTEELKNRLKAIIGEAEGIQGQGWKATWKATKGTTVTDWRALAEHLNPTPMDIARYTTTKAGVRRFLMKEIA